jgi:hypothetical protein
MKVVHTSTAEVSSSICSEKSSISLFLINRGIYLGIMLLSGRRHIYKRRCLSCPILHVIYSAQCINNHTDNRIHISV